MTDNDDRLPVEKVYEEGLDVPTNPADLVYKELEKGWYDIEFGEITVEGEIREALTDATTQLHYIYLSQLMMMGDLVRNSPRIDTKRLASVLTASRMRDVDAWGRYLFLLGERGTLSEPIRTYFHALFDDDNPVSRLIGLLYVDVLRQSIRKDHLEGITDDTFKALLTRDIEEAERNIEMAHLYLHRVNDELGDDERQHVDAQLDRYLALLEDIVRHHATTFERMGGDPDRIIQRMRDVTAEFEETLQEGT